MLCLYCVILLIYLFVNRTGTNVQSISPSLFPEPVGLDHQHRFDDELQREL